VPFAALIETMRHLQTPDATIHYHREGSGPPLILLQGAGVIGEGWRPQIDAFREQYTVIAPDNRGIGASTYHAAKLTVADMAGDALAIADAEGFDRFHLAGHSIGGLIAQEIALRARARVLSLALLCTFERGGQAARLTPDIIWSGLRTRLGTAAMRRRAFMQLVMPGDYLAGVDESKLAGDLAKLFGHDLASQPPIVMKQLQAAAKYDASSRLSELAGVRTRVISARQDRIALPEFGQALAGRIPGARYVEIAEGGHAVTIQCPNRVNELLAEHLAAQSPGV
jgi:pimeloyl-ACP methyl ester carboxylesterase